MYQNPFCSLSIQDNCICYHTAGTCTSFLLLPPVWELEGRTVHGLKDLTVCSNRPLNDSVCEMELVGSYADLPGVSLRILLRLSARSPVIRFRYILRSDRTVRMTKSTGSDRICYTRLHTPPGTRFCEVRLSDYNRMVHSYCLREYEAFRHEKSAMGPILTGERDGEAFLLAYEHGSQYPDRFLEFRCQDSELALCAVKGNYWAGETVSSDHPYESIWFQFAAVCGDRDALAAHYRSFQLHDAALYPESRKPYIFYNTWAYQERNKHLNKQTYLASMNEARILSEIDVAHRIGIEVFVLDTGWYNRTGDWEPDPGRFPDGLGPVRRKLQSYGMKLGLWFDPRMVAQSCDTLKKHAGCLISHHGQTPMPYAVWETEESLPLCPVSDYRKVFADRLIAIAKEHGVTYFKWDAVSQYECTAATHGHGTDANTEEERADCYAFQIGPSLCDIADRVHRACPDVIIDFDVTEDTRAFGLGFLAHGKYFLINNGPYFENYDLPTPAGQWSNLFVRPGHARAWICRTPLPFDKWIPSVLFLTHYLPDDGPVSQLINLGSLIQGQNGIWGDLLAVSEEGIALTGSVLSAYKEVRDDITQATVRIEGNPGDSLQVYEKLNPDTGKGAVVAFATTPGTYRYRIAGRACGPPYIFGDAAVSEGTVTLHFSQPGAAILFYGAGNKQL